MSMFKKIISWSLLVFAILFVMFWSYLKVMSRSYVFVDKLAPKVCAVRGGEYWKSEFKDPYTIGEGGSQPDTPSEVFRKIFSTNCYFVEEPKSVESICSEWDQRMAEEKAKTEEAANTLAQSISEEYKLVLELWSAIFDVGDHGYYKKHVIPVWIYEEEKDIGGEKYIAFVIGYSVKMGDWYIHEVGGMGTYAQDRMSNRVLVRKAQYQQFLLALKNTTDKSNMLSVVPDSRSINLVDELGWDLDSVVKMANLTANLRNFDGFVLAQKYPFSQDKMGCKQVMESFKQCEPQINGLYLEYNNFYDSGGDSFNFGLYPSRGKWDYSKGALLYGSPAGFLSCKDGLHHQPVFNLIDGTIDCEEAECGYYWIPRLIID